MTTVLRGVLILMSLLVLVIMVRKIRQSRAKIEDSMFWVFFALLLVVFSVFPQAANWLSDLVGTMSTANFIFLLMIFLLLIKCFSMSMRISQLETKLKELVQKIALDDNELEQVLKKEAKKDEKQQEGQKTEE
ncbi:DUF2304 domain-containing protein [Fusibacillus kribbianus]|uniref:DUF2304 domain-containing protein n=1 Tax=Fusibacillus kribbianus TaxID=3044208 RepID=A0AAP4BBP2_9FIRM|nr:DUF2304 domain-containing protein [Ruminococcus sp. YH-rum2234]MDI9242912.1 DUF2304 domain-containing protein [Ruminococcus sp. YH-rum2234]